MGANRIARYWLAAIIVLYLLLGALFALKTPAWQAPESIRKDYTKLPPVVPGGSPLNPMGAAALTLSGGGQYAIHGTNNPASIAMNGPITEMGTFTHD